MKLVEEEETLGAIELVNEKGSFLQVEIRPEDEPEQPPQKVVPKLTEEQTEDWRIWRTSLSQANRD